jgi:hypothetical protein
MQSYPVVGMGDTAEVTIMTDAKYQRCSEVEILELLDSVILYVLPVQAECDSGKDSREQLKHAAWFNPSYHVDWFGSSYWHGPHACRVTLTLSPDASEVGSEGYRLPIIWGSSCKH